MAKYIGFSTKNANKTRTYSTTTTRYNTVGDGIIPQGGIVFGKKFRLTDASLIIQDFVNALNIRKGEKVGKPNYRTTLWDFVFEPNTIDVVNAIQNEVRRVASLDPRLYVNTVSVYTKENGILLAMQLSVDPFVTANDLAVFFDQGSNTAYTV